MDNWFDDNGFITILNTQDIKEYHFTNENVTICQAKMVSAIAFVSELGNWYIQTNHDISNNTVYFKVEIKT
jgi:hypothetical protein